LVFPKPINAGTEFRVGPRAAGGIKTLCQTYTHRKVKISFNFLEPMVNKKKRCSPRNNLSLL